MPGINLSESVQRKERGAKARWSSFSGTFLMTFFLVLVLVASAMAYWYDQYLSTANAATSQSIEDEKQGISQGKIDKVADFEFRIENIAKSSEKRNYPEHILTLLETSILPEIVLTSFSFDAVKNRIILEGEAAEYKNVVQQLTKLKQSPTVSDVAVDGLKRNENGKVTFTVSMAVSGK
ncbi:MAG: PilN domain-containing protein [Candidatus Moraniibacteriota bacterium]